MSKPTDQGQLDFSLGNQKWELRDATMLTGRPGAAIHGVAKGWTRLSDWTELNMLTVLEARNPVSRCPQVRFLLRILHGHAQHRSPVVSSTGHVFTHMSLQGPFLFLEGHQSNWTRALS